MTEHTKQVPFEPTYKMLLAGQAAYLEQAIGIERADKEYPDWRTILYSPMTTIIKIATWQAMVKAAPE